MTYHGVVLLLSGYQANENYIVKEYQAIVDRCVPPLTYRLSPVSNVAYRIYDRFPNGALWILNKVDPLRCCLSLR